MTDKPSEPTSVAQDTVALIIDHASKWEPDARLLGNIRAGDIVATLAKLRGDVQGYEADLAAITACMDRLDYPHHPEDPDRHQTILRLQEMWNHKVRAEQERDDAEKHSRRLGDLLKQTANALKGPPADLSMHDWSDLPTVAAKLRAEVQATIDNHAMDSTAWSRRTRQPTSSVPRSPPFAWRSRGPAMSNDLSDAALWFAPLEHAMASSLAQSGLSVPRVAVEAAARAAVPIVEAALAKLREERNRAADLLICTGCGNAHIGTGPCCPEQSYRTHKELVQERAAYCAVNMRQTDEIDRLRAGAGAAEKERDELTVSLGLALQLKEKAEAERDAAIDERNVVCRALDMALGNARATVNPDASADAREGEA